ncbi:AAA family ATPase [Nonomuraea sp. NPDC049625]|uniref:NACHT and WD repeat domain-containing protein n=1 Tax=Nonomuraea sp. NPDC049625 TaxID=3155775 RepID=UPI00343DE613
MSETETTPRQLFADRLAELLELTADLPLKSAITQANRRRPGGRGRPVSDRRVSDWKRGRHPPESEAAFLVLIRVLIEHCRGRRVLHSRVSAGLLDEEQWRRWLRSARESPPDPVDTARPAGHADPAAVANRWASRCPYLGLAPFGQSQAEVFYGREKLTAQLVDALADRLDKPGILVVSGASGAGKSSLVHAGLLPALATGGLSAESARWPVAVVRPTTQPRDELARALARVAGRDPAAIRTLLEATPDQAHTVVRDVVDAHAAPGTVVASTGERLILVIDQFEQIFTLPDDVHPGLNSPAERQRADFITALHAAAAHPCGPDGEPAALVIAVIRSDFLSSCAAYPQLADAARDGVFLVGPMSAPQLRLTITGPAEQAGLHIAPALIDAILADLPASASDGGYEVGALPLLSEAMRVTWQHREGDQLTSHGYELSGGVARAVQTSAEAVYTALTPGRQAIARQVFHRMTTVTRDGRAVRRPIPYRRRPNPELDALDRPEAPTAAGGRCVESAFGIEDVVEAFAAQRLIVVDGETAQITHDTLLHAWGRLRGWLEDDPANRALYSQLVDDAAAWAHNGRPASYLYRAERLTATLKTRQHWHTALDRYPPLSRTEEDFLNASTKAATRAKRRRRTVLATLIGAFVVSLVASTIAIRAQQNTSHERDLAISRQLAARSELLSSDPATSALLAAAAWHIAPTSDARASLITALSRPYRGIFTGNTTQVFSVAFSPDGHTLATTDDHTIRLWDTATRRQLGAPFTGAVGGISSMVFSPDGRTLATGSDDGEVWLWDIATRHQLGAPLTGHTQSILAMAFSSDGRTLTTVGFDNTIRLWDVALPSDLVGAACAVANRALTREEWAQYVPANQEFRNVCAVSTKLDHQ